MIAQNSFGPSRLSLDMEKLTICGHGFGGTTSVVVASKDKRIKRVITFDPWLSPLHDDIVNRVISVPQPHCSVNSEMFSNNVPDN